MNQKLTVVIDANIQAFQDSMRNLNESVKGIGEKMKGINGDSLKKLGGNITDVGKKMSLISAPIVAVGGAMFKFAQDQETAFAQVSTLLTGSSADYDKYKKDIRAASSEMGVSMEDYSEAVYSSISAGQSQGDAIEFTRKAVKLAGGGFTDTSKAVDVMTTALNAYGLKSSEATNISDMLITTQNLGKTTVDALSSSMGAVIPVAQAQGVSFAQLSSGYAVLTKNGIDTAQAGTYMKSMFGELGKAGSKVDKILRKETGKSFSELQESGMNTGDVLQILQGEADKSGLKLSDMFGSVQAGSAALVLAKDNGSEFQEFLGEMEGSAGATEKAFAKMADTTKDKMAIAWTTIKNTLAEFGDIMLPVVTSVAESIGKAVGKFGELSDSTKKTILIIGGIVAAIGPVLVVVGTLVSSIGSIVTVFTAMSGAVAVAGGAMAILTGPIGLTIAAIALLGIGVVALVKHFKKDAIEPIDRFGDTVSESTKKALGGFFDLSDGASQSLADMSIRNLKVTGEMATDMIGKFDAMNTQIVDGLNKRHEEQLASTTAFFANSSVLTEAEEAAIITKQENSHNLQILSLESKNSRVKEIMDKAASENRALTQSESDEINNIKNSMNNKAVQALSASATEQKVILERMKQTAGDLSLQQAREVVTNSAKQRDESVKEAEKQYSGTVAQIIRMRDESGVISAEQATKMIAEAKKTRDESVKHAETMHKDVVKEAEKQSGDLSKVMDTMTGNQYTKWDAYVVGVKQRFDKFNKEAKDTWESVSATIKDNWNKGWEDTKRDAKQIVTYSSEQWNLFKTDSKKAWEDVSGTIKSNWSKGWEDTKRDASGIKEFASTKFTELSVSVGEKMSETKKKISDNWENAKTTSGNLVGGIYTTVTGKFGELKSSVAEKMNETKQKIEDIWNNAMSFFKAIDLRQTGKDIISGLINGIGSMANDLYEKVKGIADNITNTIKGALKIQSPSRVMYQIGEWTVEGLINGMKAMENAPAKVIDTITKNVLDKTKFYRDEMTNLRISMDRQIEFLAGSHRNTMVSIKYSEAEDLIKLEKEFAGQNLANNQDYLKKKESIIKHWGREFKLYADEEAMYVQGVEREHAGTMLTLKNIASIEAYSALKETLEKSRAANEISATEEMRIWKEAAASFEESSHQRKDSLEQFANAHERALEGMKGRNEELRKQEAAITAEYELEVDKRSKSISSFASVFDEFKIKQDKSGEDLMANLKTQVDGFKSWQENIAMLSAKAIDEGLMAELKALGPKAAGELEALNKLTDAQLTEYSALYKEKQALARKQAEAELIGMKGDTDKRINDIRNVVQAELDEINAVWAQSSSTIVNETDSELSKLLQVGVNAGQSLLDGLSSMEGALVSKAQSIASAVNSALSSVSSPSMDIKSNTTISTSPKDKVSWNAKGGIFSKATIFNTSNAGMQGVGEAGAEAIIPLTKQVLGDIGKGAIQAANSNYKNDTQAKPSGDVYNINFNVAKMTGNKEEAEKFVNEFHDLIRNLPHTAMAKLRSN